MMRTTKTCLGRMELPFFLILALLHFTGTVGTGQETVLTSQIVEGEFISNEDIPINLVIDDENGEKLLTLQQVRFETAYGNAWKFIGRVQWQSVETASWRITTELMDRQGQTLKHMRDDPFHFVTVKADRADLEPVCIDMELNSMHFEQRLHARRFRVTVERLKVDNLTKGDQAMMLTARDEKSQEPLTHAILQVKNYDRSTSSQRVLYFYAMDSEGQTRFNYTLYRDMRLMLQVQCPGHATVSKNFIGREPLPKQYDVLLPQAGRVGGTVFNEAHQPIPDVWITVQNSQAVESGVCSLFRAVKTDPQGQWSFDGIPKEAETVSLSFKHPQYRKEHCRFTGIQTDHQQTLTPGLPVQGTLYNHLNQSVPDAVVHLLPMNFGRYQENYMHVLTDDQGEFFFRCARDDMSDIQSEKGLALLVVEMPGYLPAIKKVKAGANTPEVDIHLTTGKSISGQVLDQQGHPLSDAWMVVHPFPEEYPQYGLWQMDTDAQGRFTFEHVPEHVLLTVGKQGFITVRSLPFPPETGDPVVNMMPVIRLTGTVTDATTGQPLTTFELSVCSLNDSGQPRQNRYQRWEKFQQGTFEKMIDESFTDKRVLMIRTDGYRPATSQSFSMSQGDQGLDFALTPDPSYKIVRPQEPQKQIVTGIVRNPDKTPAANVTIYTYGRYVPGTTSNEDGTFKLVFPPSNRQGEACVIVARDQQKDLATAVESFDPTQPLQVQLKSAVTLLGQVVDPQGHGLPQARISLTLWHSDTGYGKAEDVPIEEDGTFAIKAVPRYQSYSVGIEASGYGYDYIEVETDNQVSEIQLETLVLKVADQSVGGVVLDQEGNPIPEIRIYAHGKGQPHLYSKTNPQGQFTVEGLVEGPVSLQANMHGERRFHGRAEVQAGDLNIKIVAEERDSQGRRIPPKRKSLQGQSIPTWNDMGLAGSGEAFANQSMLICFWAMDQRPARRMVMQMTQKAQWLQDQGIEVLLVHMTEVEPEALDAWLKKNEVPFRSAIVTDAFEQKKRDWGVAGLPWLILTDKVHIVVNEGLSVDDLDKTLGERNPLEP